MSSRGAHLLDSTRFLHEGESLDGEGVRSLTESIAATRDRAVIANVATDPRTTTVLLREGLGRGRSVALFRTASDLERAIVGPSAISDVVTSGGQIQAVADPPAEPTFARVLLTTSGTTGVPKMIAHSWEGLTASIRAVENDIRWLLTYHPAAFAGLQVVLTAALSSQVLVSRDRADVARLAEAAVTHQPEAISGTPSFWRGFLMSLGQEARRVPVRFATLGGEATDQGTIDAIRDAFPTAVIRHIYASTELGVVFSVSDGRAGFPASWLDQPPGRYRLRVEDGELQVAGKAEPDHACDWFATGDLVDAVEDRILFRGRADSIINVGGTKVQPEGVEDVLTRHPDVVDARVYSIQSPVVGQLVAADVVARQPGIDTASVSAWARQHLSREAVPRRFRIVERLVLNAAGKKARS